MKSKNIELENEVNQLIDDTVVQYENSPSYKKEKRSVMLLAILNDTFENTFEKHLEEGSTIYKFFQNNKIHKNIVKRIGKDRNYDLNYLNSIYDDLLYGVGLNYNFDNKNTTEKSSNIFMTILIVILSIIITIVKLFCYFILTPILFLISFFVNKD